MIDIHTENTLQEHIVAQEGTHISKSESDTLTITLDAFSGPLDLLLFLVKQHKIDIYDISIVDITNQYLSYLNEFLEQDLSGLTDFYRMAAWLLLIKSQALLPTHADIDDEEIDTTKTELINTLIEYQKYKKLSDILEQRHTQFNWVSLRKETNILPLDIPKESMWEEVTATQLLSIFISLMNMPPESERIIDIHEVITISEKKTLVYELLEKSEKCSFEDIVAGGKVLSIVCAFLATLELMKQQEIKAVQHKINGEIIILRGIKHGKFNENTVQN